MEGMADAVRAALAARPVVDARDAAAERLALAYAGLMDDAAPAGKYRKALATLRRAVAGTLTEEDEPDEALALITLALADHSVASDLGPKLLTVLTGMGLTVQARGAAKEPNGPPAKKSNPVDEIKARRERRNAQ